MSVKDFFEWADALWVSAIIRDSSILFPIIETVHILALTVFLGSIVLLSMRLMGAGLKQLPVQKLATTLAPFTNWGLATMLVSGALLFGSEAVKCYENPPFFFKMGMLAAALVFHFAVMRPTLNAEAGKLRQILTGLLALVLWFGVGVGGRAIGFY